MARTNFKTAFAALTTGEDARDVSPTMLVRLGKAVRAAHPGFGIHARRYPTTTEGAILTLVKYFTGETGADAAALLTT